MRSSTTIRAVRVTTTEVTWSDDLVIEWEGPDGICTVLTAFDYAGADVRIILRHSPNERTLAFRLGQEMSYSGEHVVFTGEEVVLQWRALAPSESAVSEAAELILEMVGS